MLDDLPCEPPIPAEIGDEWICDKCARKFNYVLLALDDEGSTFEAWFTTEIGF